MWERRGLGVLGRGGLAGVWFDRLTRDARCGLVVGSCWVPAADAGMTTGALAGGAERVRLGERGVGVGAAGGSEFQVTDSADPITSEDAYRSLEDWPYTRCRRAPGAAGGRRLRFVRLRDSGVKRRRVCSAGSAYVGPRATSGVR